RSSSDLKAEPVIKWKLLEMIKGISKLSVLHLFTLLSACKFGYCVVAHQPNARVFLRLRRGLFYVDVSVLPDTFLRNNLGIREYAFSLSWRLQPGNIAGIDSRFVSAKYLQTCIVRIGVYASTGQHTWQSWFHLQTVQFDQFQR